MSDIPYSVRGGRTSTSVAGLTDTTITNLQNQQILKYDSASQKWVNAVDGGGGATISSLGDTLISNPQTNQSLVYNATVSPARWENQVTPFTQSDFTNAVSTDAAFIKHKPIISTTSSSTMVGMNTGVNKEGDLTAFGKGAGNTAANNHICIGAFSGNLGNTAAISIGYNTHATHAGSVVIHGKDLEGLSSSAVDAFYIDPLRTINALTETAGNMKINMYNTSTKEIFLTDNLLVPGKTKLNGTLEVSNGIGSVNQVLTSNNTGALTWTDKSQLTYTAAAGGTGLSLTGTVFENTKPDETVILNNGNNINVTGTYPQFTINSTDTNTTYTAAAGGTGLSLTGTVFENTKPDETVILNNGNNVNVTGTYPQFTINSTDTNTTYTAAAGGTGLSLTGTVFENTKPDLTVVLNNGNNVNVTGTYPSFTINSTDTNTTYTAAAGGTGLSLTGTVFENTKPDLTVVLNNGSNVNVTGTYPSFTINSTDTNTTYTNGSNMSLVGTEFNIPQSVATTASPSFTALTLGNTGTNQGVINLQDVTNTGRDTVANIKGFKDGTNGGDLQFFTKVDGGNVTPKLRINNEGKLGFRGANYGTANQYLKNNASGLPEWTTVTSVSQAPLDTPVVATPSGTGNITLTSGTGLNTLLTFTPAAGTTYTNGSNLSLSASNEFSVVTNPTFGTVTAALNGNAYTSTYASYATSLLASGYQIYIHNAGGVPELRSTTGVAAPQNVHVFYAEYAGQIWPSDDRIKWNETLLTSVRSTNIIKDMKFYQYDILKRPFIDKYDTYDPSKCRKGFGVIAQEVEALKVKYPELSDVVKNTGVNGDIKAVNYNNLFSIMGATIQNLIKSVETLEAEVKILKSK